MLGNIERSLLAGLQYHARQDGTVYRIHAGGHLIGEVVIGEEVVRVNIRDLPPEAEAIAQAHGIEFSGRASTWAGGVRVDEDNLEAVKEVLDAVAREAETRVVQRSTVQDCINQLERAARDGVLDDSFQDALAELLTRVVTNPRPASRRRRRQMSGRRDLLNNH